MSRKPTWIPKITLEQWAALKAVVDEGGYAQAAEKLNKSQSSISYAITRLNELLPYPALRLEGRKAVLTESGLVLYRHATNLLEQAQVTEQMAHYLANGWETRITLVTDAVTPMTKVMCALQLFSQTCPLTRVKVLETSLSGTDEAMFNRECDIAITPRVPPGFLGDPLPDERMLAVAHRSHPLARLASISEAELKNHRQIVVRDSGVKREQDAGWLGSEQRWTFSHFASSVDAVRRGLGFAFLPEHRIADALAKGELVQLPLEIGAERVIPLSLVITSPSHAGPATRALAKILRERFYAPAPDDDLYPT
jgi:DNA-binding transcriptional LysR family regulator